MPVSVGPREMTHDGKGEESVFCAAVSVSDKDEAEIHMMLVGRFCASMGVPSQTAIAAAGALDSLLLSRARIAVIDRPDSLAEGLLESIDPGDCCVWVVREEDYALLRKIDSWIGRITQSDHFERLRRSHLRGKNNVSLYQISPYDDIIKAGAEASGWDWRLLSSIVYHESRFTNEASSGKGAVGLMQIREGKYSADTLLDPAVNLSIGSRYLNRLEKMFTPLAADSTEALKFALAAYNAGEGMVRKWISAAQADSTDASRWDNVEPYAKKHTQKYVREVLKTYSDYCMMYE